MTEKLVDRWGVRNVDPTVIKSVRLYALEHNINVAEALKELVELALTLLNDKPEYGVLQSRAFSVSGNLAAARKALNQHNKKFGNKK
jgi:hypothetical protein